MRNDRLLGPTDVTDGEYKHRHLYELIYERVIKAIAKGEWLPNVALPSEQALAREVGASQGTVRKVLDQLTAQGVLRRHQGKGTFVVEQTAEVALYRFFKLARPGGVRVVPAVASIAIQRRVASPVDQAKLQIEAEEEVIEITRLRTIDDVPAIRERIVIPMRLFPGFDEHQPLPDILYSFYQSAFGIHMVSAQEEVTATAADAEDARLFELAVGDPIMKIDRVAFAIDNVRVESRISRINGRILNYRVSLP